jgi:hypothetical protein
MGVDTLDSMIPLPIVTPENNRSIIHDKIKRTTITGVGVAKGAISNLSSTSTRALSNISSIATGGVNKLKSSISDLYSMKG